MRTYREMLLYFVACLWRGHDYAKGWELHSYRFATGEAIEHYSVRICDRCGFENQTAGNEK